MNNQFFYQMILPVLSYYKFSENIFNLKINVYCFQLLQAIKINYHNEKDWEIQIASKLQ